MAAQTTPFAPKIMIIRHAEKPPTPQTNPATNAVDIYGAQEGDSLIVQGWQRAGALVTLFAPSRGPLQDPGLATPQFIYACGMATQGSGKKKKGTPPVSGASDDSDEDSNRPQETITPLSKKLKLTPNFDYGKTASEMTALITSAMNCPGVVLISWPHGQIPNLAGNIALSSNNTMTIPTKWPGDRFDVVWVFDLDGLSSAGTGAYVFSQVPQLLLAGDSHHIIKASDKSKGKPSGKKGKPSGKAA